MNMNPKKLAAEKAVEFVQSGMILGLGTGTTAYWAIERIGEMIRNSDLKIRAIATSKRSADQAAALGIPLVSFGEIDQIDLTIDGADEADGKLNLIKGGGGALLREKIVATNSRQMVVVVDGHKLVNCLGKFPLPVEVIPFGWEKVFENLGAMGCEPLLRKNSDSEREVFLTDNGNYIIDCSFGEIADPATLEDKINAITGVADNGLFVGIASKLVVGYESGEVKVLERILK
jgi:ribose 5-phosphate isomerase A